VLAATLTNLSERDEPGLRYLQARFFGELSPGREKRILIRLHLAFGNTPRAVVFLAKEGSTRMNEKQLEPGSATIHEKGRAFHRLSVIGVRLPVV
jgi:hypothetical protein